MIRTEINLGNSRTARRRRLPAALNLVVCLLLFSPWLLAQRPKTPPAAPAADLPALLATAKDALNRNDFPAAIKALSVVVEKEPEMVAAWFNLAYAYGGMGRSDEAVKAYEQTLEIQPDLFEARLNLGILLIQEKKADAALEHLSKAVELKPEHARSHLYYGRALQMAGQAEAAEKQFGEVLRLDPQSAIAHFDLAQLFYSEKNYTAAVEHFRRAHEIDPKLAQAQLGTGLALEGMGQIAEAAHELDQYLVAMPDDIETRFHLARLYLQMENYEQALQNLEKVYAVNPERPGLAAALGDANASLKKLPESEKFYRQAVLATPNEPDLHRALGQTLLDQQKFTEAESEFRACLRLDPKNLDAFKGLASSLYLQKRYPEALPLFEGLSKAADAPPGVFFVLATCYDHLQAQPQALEAYERFLQLSNNRSPDQEWQARQRAKLLRRELRK